jgi:hypothetical protein
MLTLQLERHKVVHSKERPYECPRCELSYSQRESLKIHVTIHHPDYVFSRDRHPPRPEDNFEVEDGSHDTLLDPSDTLRDATNLDW